MYVTSSTFCFQFLSSRYVHSLQSFLDVVRIDIVSDKLFLLRNLDCECYVSSKYITLGNYQHPIDGGAEVDLEAYSGFK